MAAGCPLCYTLLVVCGHLTSLPMTAGKARRIVCMCGAGISVSAGGSTLQHATLQGNHAGAAK